jgi:maltooligosyltrehalose trehalohydrolase
VGDHARLLELYRSLASLRREHAELAGLGFAETQVEYDDGARWLRFRRGSVEVMVNLSEQKVTLGRAEGPVLLSTEEVPAPDDGTLALGPWSAAVVKAS